VKVVEVGAGKSYAGCRMVTAPKQLIRSFALWLPV